LQGHVNIKVLTEAFEILTRENPILRARYILVEGQPARFISAEASGPQCYMDDELSSETLQNLVEEPFDLAKDQLFRVIIWDRGETGPELEVTMITHHIITDKASLALMLQSVSRSYQSLVKLEESLPNGVKEPQDNSSPARDATYIDWVQWYNVRQATPELQPANEYHIEFWKQHLEGMQPITQIHRSEARGQASGTNRSISIPSAKDAVAGQPRERYSQRLAVAATALALRTVYGASDIAIGLPYMNRDEPGTAEMLGLFVDQLPIRLTLDDRSLASADALLEAVTSEINIAVEHQLPYAQVQSVIKGESKGIWDDIVDVMVLYHWQSDAIEKSLSLGADVCVETIIDGAKPAGALFPLLLEYSEREGGLHVEIEFNAKVVPAEKIATLAALLPAIIQALAQRTMPDAIIVPKVVAPFFSNEASMARY
jgi:gliotoxin/aspirochlorine biosynthesis peptide synthetase